MNRQHFGHTDSRIQSQASFSRRWLLACSFLVILPALLCCGVVTPAFADPPTAYININATAPDNVQGYTNPLVFGHNFCFLSPPNCPPGLLWDHVNDNLVNDQVDNPSEGATVKSKIRDLAPTILRFPGGKVSDIFFWENGLDPRDSDWDDYSIIEHMKLVTALGAEALITVNYGTGSTVSIPLITKLKRAQALVAFCNGRTDDTRLLDPYDTGQKDPVWGTVADWARKRAKLGFPKPFDVRYWQVGNEPYYSQDPITWEPNISPMDYANDFISFVQAMKKVDPKIRIGAAGIQSPDPYKPNQVNWNYNVLGMTRSFLDFLSTHPYYPSASKSQAGGDYQNLIWFKAVMAGATQAMKDLNEIRGMIDEIVDNPNNPPAQRRKVGLAVTEYGTWLSSYDAVPGPSNEWSNLARALFDADLLLGLIRGKGLNDNLVEDKILRLTAATSWNLYQNFPTSAIGPIWGQNKWGTKSTRPHYYALQMVKEALATKRLVTTEVTSNSFTIDQTVGNVEADLSVPYLQAQAALPNANQNSLFLVVLNRHTGDIDGNAPPITARITVRGFTPASATIKIFPDPNPPLENDPGAPEPQLRKNKLPVKLASHNERQVFVKPKDIGTISLSNIPDGDPTTFVFDYPFNPHSLTVLELKP